MRKQATFATERFSYDCTQLGAIEGRGALLRLQKIASKAAGGIDEMIDAMTVQDFDYFCALFAKATKVKLENGNKPLLSDAFDTHFAGEYFELVQWLTFSIGLNFGPFFQSIQDKNQTEKIKSAFQAGTGQDQAPSAQDE